MTIFAEITQPSKTCHNSPTLLSVISGRTLPGRIECPCTAEGQSFLGSFSSAVSAADLADAVPVEAGSGQGEPDHQRGFCWDHAGRLLMGLAGGRQGTAHRLLWDSHVLLFVRYPVGPGPQLPGTAMPEPIDPMLMRFANDSHFEESDQWLLEALTQGLTRLLRVYGRPLPEP